MYPHRIRLRGPWECEPLTRAGPGPLPPPCRVTMPCRWHEAGLADFAGTVRCRRRFGYPGRLDACERVWLTFAGVDGRAEVRLNNALLGGREDGTGPFEFEVTGLLRDRNELTVDVECSGPDGGLWGEVALEVRCTAFLRGLRAWAEGGRLHVAGEVVGTSDGALELYAVLGRFTAIYAALGPLPGRRPFHVTSEELAADRWGGPPSDVRVELVHGATVWYGADVEIGSCPR